MKTLLVIDKSDDTPLLEVKYTLKTDLAIDIGKVWSVNGEINEIIGWNSDLSEIETSDIFFFTTGWQETILNFRGEDRAEGDGYYQQSVYGLGTMAIAMMIPAYLAKKYIYASGVYMERDELKYIDTHPILQGLEFREK